MLRLAKFVKAITQIFGTSVKLIIDTDADIARLKNGLDISRIQKKDQLTKNHLLKSSKANLKWNLYPN